MMQFLSGSLLGLHFGDDADPDVTEVESVPVGYERQLMMYSMDLEEYILANGYAPEAVDELRGYYERKQKVQALQEKILASYVRERDKTCPAE